MKPTSVFLADFIFYTMWCAALLFVLGPYMLLRMLHAPDLWQWSALALAILLLVPMYWALSSVRKRAPGISAFIGRARAYAKQRRDLSLEARNLSAIEYLCSGDLLIFALGVSVALAAVAINLTIFNSGLPLWAGAVVVIVAGILVLIPVQFTAIRVCYYLGLRMAARFGGR